MFLITGDRYGISNTETSVCGNLYAPVSSAGTVVSSQSLSAVALQSMSKVNSPLMSNKSNLTASQQMPNAKVKPIVQLEKMNFQSQQCLGDDHLSSNQPQQYQQQPQQFQHQHQFAQHLSQQKLQSQQQQLLLRSSAVGAQLPPNRGAQVKSKLENHDETPQNQFQQNAVVDQSKGNQLLL